MAKDATTAKKKKKKKGMTKTDKFFLAGLLIVAIAAAAYVLATWDWPTHDPKQLTGKWLYDTSELNIQSTDTYKKMSSTYWEFGEDGSFTITDSASGEASSTGTYAVSGETLTLTFGDSPQEFAFVIRGDTLTLGTGDDSVELSRVN